MDTLGDSRADAEPSIEALSNVSEVLGWSTHEIDNLALTRGAEAMLVAAQFSIQRLACALAPPFAALSQDWSTSRSWRCSVPREAPVEAKSGCNPQSWGQVLGTPCGRLRDRVSSHEATKNAICWRFLKPSDGLEPSTPSLPWRLKRSSAGRRIRASRLVFRGTTRLLRHPTTVP